MEYQYDVFISYKANEYTNPWVDGFKNKFMFWLTQALGGYEPIPFYAPIEIGNGADWEKRLANGLKTSKCILCIWTPEYFHSNWCVSEWQSFELRQKEYETSIIIRVVQLIDGESYPHDAKRRQKIDFTDHNPTFKFDDTTKAKELDEKIKQLAMDAADSIIGAPDFKEFDIKIINENEFVKPKPIKTKLTL